MKSNLSPFHRFIVMVSCVSMITTSLHAEWVQTNGPYGGNVQCFAVSGTNLFAGNGNVGGGVYLSTNNGGSWAAVSAGLPMGYLNALAVSGTNIFAGTDGSGVYLTTNNGTSWTVVSAGLTNTYVSALAVSGTNIFAGTSGGGIFRSTNNGTNWTAVDSGLTDMYINNLAVSGSNVFVGTSSSGAFLSTNDGASWTSLGSFFSDVAALFVTGTNVYVGDAATNFMYISPDNGTSWRIVNPGEPANAGVTAIVVSGTNLFAGTGGGGVYLSTNNGTSWAAANTGVTDRNINAFIVSGANVLLGSRGGVLLWNTIGASWTTVNNGLANATVGALITSSTNIFAGTYGGGVFLSTNNGTSWSAVNNGLTNTNVWALAVSPDGSGGTNLFAGMRGGGVFLSTNSGTSWTGVNAGLTTANVTRLAASANGVGGTNLFAGTQSSGVFLSTNNGANWSPANNGLPNNSIGALAASPNGAGGTNVYASAAGYGGVYVSTNSGTNWSFVQAGFTTNSGVMAIAVSGTTVFAGTFNEGVYRSTNNGTSWTAVNNGVTNMYLSALAMSPNGAGGTNLFTGGIYGGGVYLSTNNGASWATVNNGLGDFTVNSLATTGTNVFTGSSGGVWRRPLSEMLASTVNVSTGITTGWNMISNPVTTPVPDDSASHLFPSIMSRAFFFSGGYFASDTMGNRIGYWGKFPAPATNSIMGTSRLLDTVNVTTRWNMVGSISSPVDTGTIVSLPPGIRTSDWFGWSGTGYAIVSQITPGKAYWIKSNAIGKFVLASPLVEGPVKGQTSGGMSLVDLNSLTITDGKGGSQTLYFGPQEKKEIKVSLFDMPPPPPAGVLDARFESAEGGSMVRTHGADVSSRVEFPVSIRSDAYPVTVSWKVSKAKYELTDALGGKAFQPKEMNGQGSVRITNQGVTRVVVTLVGEESLPMKFTLHQNYPNPFNPTTTISYDLPTDSRVSLKIYDVIGQEVANVVNEEQKAGYKSAVWNASGVASGVYFYRLDAGSFTSVKKLILLK